MADHQREVDIGQNIDLDKVLMVGSKTETFMGHPYLSQAGVTATVEEITEADKVIIFKKRRRKNSKNTRGFRRSVVTLRINDINFDPENIIQNSKSSTAVNDSSSE